MRVGLISDLHLEFRDRWDREVIFSRVIEDCLRERPNVLFNLGDMTVYKKPELTEMFEVNVLEAIKALHPSMDYVYVPGNHDYYGGPAPESPYVVNGGIGGEKVHVSTLWTNFGRDSASTPEDIARNVFVATRCIADFRAISGFTSARCSDLYYESVASLDSFKPAIVGTHFVPTRRAILDKWKKDETSRVLNHYFANDLDQYIEDSDVRLWMHGHTHDPCDYYLGKTRIVCNPLGYPNECRAKDYKVLVVEA